MYCGGQVPVKDLCWPTKHAVSHPKKSQTLLSHHQVSHWCLHSSSIITTRVNIKKLLLYSSCILLLLPLSQVQKFQSTACCKTHSPTACVHVCDKYCRSHFIQSPTVATITCRILSRTNGCNCFCMTYCSRYWRREIRSASCRKDHSLMRASFSSPAASKTTYGTVLVSAKHNTLRLHHHTKNPLVLNAHAVNFTYQLSGDISLYYGHQMSKVQGYS